MSDQRRLELVKIRHANTGIIADGDVEWLIEQAERVEELGTLSSNEWVDVVGKFERYNALREALKFYADDENYETKVVVNPGRNNHYREILCDEGNIARQALERESK